MALGLASDRIVAVSLGAGALFMGLLASLANVIVVLTRLWRR